MTRRSKKMHPESKPYRWLAEYYDRVFSTEEPFGKAAQQALLDPVLPEVESACDMACGTGSTALKLASRGIRTYAVDLSPGMCRIARRRTRKAGVQVRVSRQDMRELRLPEKVDLVLCEFDALNHLHDKRDLARVLKRVGAALKPGGYFFYDVNNRLGFESYWKGVWCVEKPGIVLVMKNGNNASQDRAWSDCIWFLKKGRSWTRHTERVEEVCWSDKEMRRALQEAGFTSIRSWDSTPFLKPNPLMVPGCRTHYLVRKQEAGGS